MGCENVCVIYQKWCLCVRLSCVLYQSARVKTPVLGNAKGSSPALFRRFYFLFLQCTVYRPRRWFRHCNISVADCTAFFRCLPYRPNDRMRLLSNFVTPGFHVSLLPRLNPIRPHTPQELHCTSHGITRYPDLSATLLNADVNGTATLATLFAHNLWGLDNNHYCSIYRPATAFSLRMNFAVGSTPMMCVCVLAGAIRRAMFSSICSNCQAIEGLTHTLISHTQVPLDERVAAWFDGVEPDFTALGSLRKHRCPVSL